ncbi:MAG: hypothetical protein CL663_06470, partial [Bacteroidetes bacterium]|nr:hypothetical protein [Bacteroidota bacterium]
VRILFLYSNFNWPNFGEAYTENKILDIYLQVVSEFKKASKKRGEHIPAQILNSIVLEFILTYEMSGEDFYKEHLIYEIDRYLKDGLREGHIKNQFSLI